MRWGILPAGAERRLANTSCFDRQQRRLMWRVEWRFEAAGFTAVDACVPKSCACMFPEHCRAKVSQGPAAVEVEIWDLLTGAIPLFV